jgi:hypothetical protein
MPAPLPLPAPAGYTAVPTAAQNQIGMEHSPPTGHSCVSRLLPSAANPYYNPAGLAHPSAPILPPVGAVPGT